MSENQQGRTFPLEAISTTQFKNFLDHPTLNKTQRHLIPRHPKSFLLTQKKVKRKEKDF